MVSTLEIELWAKEQQALTHSGQVLRETLDGVLARLGQKGASALAGKKSGCGCSGGGHGEKKCGCHDQTPATVASPAAAAKTTANGEPDFDKMTAAEKRAYQQAKRDRVFG